MYISTEDEMKINFDCVAVDSAPGMEQPLIGKYAKVFKDLLRGRPPYRSIWHRINGMAAPVSKPMYRLSPDEKLEAKSMDSNYLAKQWIQSSLSPHSSPILFVHNNVGGMRMCIYYRALE